MSNQPITVIHPYTCKAVDPGDTAESRTVHVELTDQRNAQSGWHDAAQARTKSRLDARTKRRARSGPDVPTTAAYPGRPVSSADHVKFKGS